MNIIEEPSEPNKNLEYLSKIKCWQCNECDTINNLSLTLSKYEMKCCLSRCSNKYDPMTTAVILSNEWNICIHKQNIEDGSCHQCQTTFDYALDNQKCTNNFITCKSCDQVKFMLKEYQKITDKYQSKSPQSEINKFINEKLFGGIYSLPQLLND
eukprot:179468_1